MLDLAPAETEWFIAIVTTNAKVPLDNNSLFIDASRMLQCYLKIAKKLNSVFLPARKACVCTLCFLWGCYKQGVTPTEERLNSIIWGISWAEFGLSQRRREGELCLWLHLPGLSECNTNTWNSPAGKTDPLASANILWPPKGLRDLYRNLIRKPTEVVDAPSLETFKINLYRALSSLISCRCLCSLQRSWATWLWRSLSIQVILWFYDDSLTNFFTQATFL